jgi:hypothetical protein
VASRIDQHELARVVVQRRMIDERHLVSPGRDPWVAEPSAGAMEDLADRKLEQATRLDLVNDRQVRAVR